MKNRIFASLAVATTLGLLIPVQSHAFGLGTLKVHSALNQPLNAEIPLTAVSSTDEDNIQVRLASDHEFTKAGLKRSYLLTKLKFNVVYSNNKPRVMITSDEPIREPFLDFLITATSGDGQLIREYTVLLDPPKQVFNDAPAATQSSQTTSSAASESSPQSYYSGSSVTSSAPGQYGPTSRSDTLWHIASKTRPQQSLSVNQMMMALLKANPKAFQENNINGLKAGYTLDIPSVSEIEKLNRSQALAAVREQNREWKSRNANPVAASAASEENTAATTVNTATQSEKTTANTDQQAATQQEAVTPASAKPGNQAKLELVSPEEKQNLNDDKQAPQGDKNIKHLTEQLTLAQEAIEAQNQENSDIKQRMSMMEEQLKTLHRLINLKDKDLARMQSLVDKQATASTATDAASVADETLSAMGQSSDNQINLQGDAPAGANATGDTTELPTQTSDTTAESGQKGDSTPVADKTASSESNQNPGSADMTAQQAANTESPTSQSAMPASEMDQVVDKTAEMLNLDKGEVHTVLNKVRQFVEKHQLETGLGALLILLILWLIIRRRNRVVPWDKAVGNIDNSTSTRVVSPTQPEREDPPTAPEVTEITGSMPDVRVKTADELVEQADMFVGYADYVQAKSSLEQAHAQEPDNVNVIQKLLFVLYKQKQTDAFINMAQSAQLDHDSEEWQDIAAWGRELAPANQLFIQPVEPAEQDAMDTFEQDTVEPADTSDELDNLIPSLSDQEPQADAETEQQEQDTEQDDHIDFDLSSYDLDTSESTEAEEQEEQKQQSDMEQETQDENLLDFDLGTVSDSNDTLSLDIDETSEQEQAEQPEPNEQENEKTDQDDTLNFDLEPAVPEEETESLNIDDTELDAISDEELEAAAQALGADEAEADEYAQDELTQDLEFDIGDFDEIDEAETKLDLAAAYIDMGDPDGAKTILEEVVKEGSDEQKARAQSLLQTLTE